MSIDWEKVKAEAVQILSAYIRIDTTNPPGREMAAARFLGEILETVTSNSPAFKTPRRMAEASSAVFSKLE